MFYISNTFCCTLRLVSVTEMYFILTGFADDANTKVKASKGKSEKKGGKDEKSTEKGKSSKEVISQRHIALRQLVVFISARCVR